MRFVKTDSMKGEAAQKQPFVFYDLWTKDEHGNWGQSIGTFEGSLPAVNISGHQTKVWRAVPAPSAVEEAFASAPRRLDNEL